MKKEQMIKLLAAHAALVRPLWGDPEKTFLAYCGLIEKWTTLESSSSWLAFRRRVMAHVNKQPIIDYSKIKEDHN